MNIQTFADFYDQHPEHQEQLRTDPLKYWQMELGELKNELNKG